MYKSGYFLVRNYSSLNLQYDHNYSMMNTTVGFVLVLLGVVVQQIYGAISNDCSASTLGEDCGPGNTCQKNRKDCTINENGCKLVCKPKPETGCHIDQTAPTKCDAYTSLANYKLINTAFDFSQAISLCQGAPECTGVLNFIQVYYAIADDIDAIPGEECSIYTMKVYQCQAK